MALMEYDCLTNVLNKIFNTHRYTIQISVQSCAVVQYTLYTEHPSYQQLNQYFAVLTKVIAIMALTQINFSTV